MTHSVSLLHEVLPADVRHDSCRQRVSHHVHHRAEPVPVNTKVKGQKLDPKHVTKVHDIMAVMNAPVFHCVCV